MPKSTRNIVLIFSIFIGLIACTTNNYVEYRPHYLSANNEHKYYGEPELDSIEFKNTIQVLEYYGDHYKTKNGNIILITEELHNDWTLLWNYTTKANDTTWLKAHKLK